MKKLNQKGFAHWIIPALVVVAIGGIGTVFLTQSHAETAPGGTIASATIKAGNWNYQVTSIVSDDGTNVLKIPAGHVQVVAVDGFAPVTSLVKANYNDSATICINARVGSGNGSYELGSEGVAGQGALTANTNPSYISKYYQWSWDAGGLSTSYQVKCHAFTIISSGAYAKYVAGGWRTFVGVENLSSTTALFVKSVVITSN